MEIDCSLIIMSISFRLEIDVLCYVKNLNYGWKCNQLRALAHTNM